MSKSKLCVIFGVAVLGITLVYSVFAQQSSTASAKASATVALVDLNYVMGQNATLDTEMVKIREMYQKQFQPTEAEQEKLKQLRDELSRLNRDTPRYKQLETEMLGLSNTVSTRQVLLYKEMTEAQLKVVQKIYNDTVKYTELLANHFGMTIVLNYDRSDLPKNVPMLANPQQYDEFMMRYTQAIQVRTVAWADKGLVDLSSLVLQQIQKARPETIRAASTGQPAAAAGAVGNGVPRR